jgi:5-methylthioadenosine/S-adenosylhomocysteine deaminase
LHIATLGAAQALGLDQQIGSIAPGKMADLCAVNFDAVGLSPVYHPLSHLVYAAGRDDVSHVWVAGRLAVDQGRLIGLDAGELRAKARAWQTRIVELS